MNFEFWLYTYTNQQQDSNKQKRIVLNTPIGVCVQSSPFFRTHISDPNFGSPKYFPKFNIFSPVEDFEAVFQNCQNFDMTKLMTKFLGGNKST
jgi:hypothetical protein